VVASALESDELKNQCFQVAGHTCDLGDNAYNMELSMKRAAAVKDYLVSQGVNPNRLMTTGFGETSPMVPNSGEAQRSKNRRVDLGALPPR
jgi:OOP family OmpA-OmpF porin